MSRFSMMGRTMPVVSDCLCAKCKVQLTSNRRSCDGDTDGERSSAEEIVRKHRDGRQEEKPNPDSRPNSLSEHDLPEFFTKRDHEEAAVSCGLTSGEGSLPDDEYRAPTESQSAEIPFIV